MDTNNNTGGRIAGPHEFGKLTPEERAHWSRVGEQLDEKSQFVESMLRQGKSASDITQAELERQFAHHPPQGTQLQRYAAIRAAALLFAQTVVLNTRLCADQVATIRMIRQAAMSANSTIACNEEYGNGPRDVVDVIEQHKLDLRAAELARDQAILERDQWKQKAEARTIVLDNSPKARQDIADAASHMETLTQQANAWSQVFRALTAARPNVHLASGVDTALHIVGMLQRDLERSESAYKLTREHLESTRDELQFVLQSRINLQEALNKERELREFNAAIADGNLDAWMWQVWCFLEKPGYKVNNKHMLQQLLDKYGPKAEAERKGQTVRIEVAQGDLPKADPISMHATIHVELVGEPQNYQRAVASILTAHARQLNETSNMPRSGTRPVYDIGSISWDVHFNDDLSADNFEVSEVDTDEGKVRP